MVRAASRVVFAERDCESLPPRLPRDGLGVLEPARVAGAHSVGHSVVVAAPTGAPPAPAAVKRQ